MNHLEYAFGRAGLFKQLRQSRRRQWILLGRFEDKGVTAGNGHWEHPQRNHCREVERRNTGTHTQRLGKRVGINFAGNILYGFAHHHGWNISRVLDHFDTTPDVAFRVFEGFTGFLGQDFGNLVVMFLEKCLVTHHQTGPLGYRNLTPCLERFTGILDRQLHFIICGTRHLRDHLVGSRIGNVNPFLRGALAEFTFNKKWHFLHDPTPDCCCRWQWWAGPDKPVQGTGSA